MFCYATLVAVIHVSFRKRIVCCRPPSLRKTAGTLWRQSRSVPAIAGIVRITAHSPVLVAPSTAKDCRANNHPLQSLPEEHSANSHEMQQELHFPQKSRFRLKHRP